MTVDRRPDDCDHDKPVATVTLDSGEEAVVCMICNDVQQVTLDDA